MENKVKWWAMLTARKKANIVKEFQIHDKDTGSAQVQIGVLSKRIAELTSHLKKNPKDNHSRRGLLQMVSKRRRLLKYLDKTSAKEHSKVAKKIGIKK